MIHSIQDTSVIKCALHAAVSKLLLCFCCNNSTTALTESCTQTHIVKELEAVSSLF